MKEEGFKKNKAGFTQQSVIFGVKTTPSNQNLYREPYQERSLYSLELMSMEGAVLLVLTSF